MDKKNTLLLTVIAIATLLVAVVGATFAYFSAQTGTGAEAQMNVTTSTTDTATMSTFDNLSINATLDNFGKNDGSLTDSTAGYVSFTASNADGRESAEYCYTAEISISENEFIYSLPTTKGGSNHYPELVLNIWKESNTEDNTLEGIDTGDTNRYAQSMHIDTESHQLFYDDNITLNNGKICEKNTDAENDQDGTNCKSIVSPYKGYDITIVGNGSYAGGNDQGLKDITTIKIPKKESIVGESLSDQDFIHKITATGGKESKTIYDKWKVSVTLVNYKDEDITGSADGAGDQSKYEFNGAEATNKGNAGRKFNATLSFKPVACSTD